MKEIYLDSCPAKICCIECMECQESWRYIDNCSALNNILKAHPEYKRVYQKSLLHE